MRLPLAITLSAASHSAVPPIAAEREPPVPAPQATASVSPSMKRSSSGRDAEARRRDLAVHGLVALALALGADRERRAARGIEADLGVLHARRRGALDGVGEADAAKFAAGF